MAEYAHLPDDGVLVVELVDSRNRIYPGDYRAKVADGILAIYPPPIVGVRADPIAVFRSGWSFSYSGHELGDRTPVIDDPLGQLNGPLSEHQSWTPAEVDAAYADESGAE